MNNLEEMTRILDEATRVIGPNRNGAVEGPLYTFLRRYGPMPCADVVLVPEGNEPSVILAQRDNSGVAPGQWWIFGGRVDKNLDYLKVAETKTKREIGLDVIITPENVIGLGKTYFKPDTNEKVMRDYDVSTPNVCFAVKVPMTDMIKDKISPADGHTANWKVFKDIEADWHPYIVHSVAHAWNRFYGEKGIEKIADNREIREILSDESHFMPLQYNPLRF